MQSQSATICFTRECTRILKKCSLDQGKLTHSRILQSGLLLQHHNLHSRGRDRFLLLLWNGLLGMYARHGRVGESAKMLHQIPNPDACSWTLAISCHSRNGSPAQALQLFRMMMKKKKKKKNNNTCNEFCVAAVLPACDLGEGIQLHAFCISSGLYSDIGVGNAIVNMYCKVGFLEDARQVFDEMCVRNVVSWTSLIVGFSKQGLWRQAFENYVSMCSSFSAICPNAHAIAAALSACASLGVLHHGLQVHLQALKLGCLCDPFVMSALLCMYARCGSLHDARMLFDMIEIKDKDISCWNTILDAYVQAGMLAQAVQIFSDMPNKDSLSWTAMISGYAKAGLVDEAWNLFQQCPCKDTPSWTAVLSAFVQNGFWKHGICLFRQTVQINKVLPDFMTFATILPACSALAAPCFGTQIHAKMILAAGLYDASVLVINALMDMYCKCGCLDEARRLFDKTSFRVVTSWNTMIAGYALHGRGHDSLELFQLMIEHGDVIPDEITFVNLLSACNHAGLVEDGYKLFGMMTEVYCLDPTMEHFSCIVDLLGRAGRLEEALEIVKRLPKRITQANKHHIWGCLLTACRMHNKVHLAQELCAIIFQDRNVKDGYLPSFLEGKYSETGVNKQTVALAL